MQKRISIIFFLSCLFILFAGSICAQPIWSIRLRDSVEKKPTQFEDRKLGSETSTEKKFTTFRKFKQNLITHYNYYYNANNKVNAVVEKAIMANKDDYTKLLTFYPYSLDNTAAQKTDLDSVIIKSTAGILLHDLRNDWIDNMYFLIGKAYFFRKDFDSAAATFQFINYNLFPREKGEDDERVVGTNAAAANSTISIANKEKRNILEKLTSLPPSRNDALIWMVRTQVEQKEFGDAAGLINTLHADPNLPLRLHDDLEEVTAYWFFQQQIYDSAAAHLEKALTNAPDLEYKARWEFLLAQLYEMTHQFGKASEYYEKASKQTASPLMDIHAQLNNAKMMRSTDSAELDKSIKNLVSMAKKDRFESYRDILYYSAGQLAMQKPDTNEAIGYYKESVKYNEANVSYKNKAFLQLAEIAFNQKDYRTAFSNYDSLKSDDTSLTDKLPEIQKRRTVLAKIVEKLTIIEREDSLQRIAAMPQPDREAYVKKLSRKLMKAQGDKISDDGNDAGLVDINPFASQTQTPLFTENTKGEWYFYNSSLRTKGNADFKTKWGKRANSDNWRRKSALDAALTAPSLADMSPGNMNPDDTTTIAPPATNNDQTATKEPATAADQPNDFTFVGIMSELPLTSEKLAKSNSLVAVNLFSLGKIYQNDLEDYQQAVNTYEESLSRFPDSLYNGELYLNLYYCYTRLGNTAKADYYKNLLNSKFADSHSAQLLNNPIAFKADKKDPVVTKKYEDIYTLMIEGDFDKAIEKKKKADSLYGNNYWSPQLLYIESMYYVKVCNDDSSAKVELNNLVKLYPQSPMKPKAENLLNALNKRKEIEAYLKNLQVTRAKDDDVVIIEDEPAKITAPIKAAPVTVDSSKLKTQPVVDTAKKILPVTAPVTIKQDSVKKIVPPPVVKTDSVKKILPPAVKVVNGYSFDSTQTTNVIMQLDKVDPTFVNEAVNALNRYNAEKYSGQSYIIRKAPFDGGQTLLVVTMFTNTDAAMDYINRLKKAAQIEISWLPANKYSFYIISEDNLQLLKTNKDIPGYKNALKSIYPGKF
ncbi:type IX secretion system periplasmic lipoprotein PorW/SprE [Ferruginibacter albus]|uniref:type IX secretion system periplasmic lipoprotein PorW/SprE n=1 Tax=Ferruginibacter albus TaxID=2875540 RepID=UPI001CC58C4D|nr:tetratricopeptide repeat protein [Ferruginibacter albus]UAY51488.1 tetratricopeptide repeat protein [Ferruginibacter albus]